MRGIDNLTTRVRLLGYVQYNSAETVADGLASLWATYQTLTDEDKATCYIKYGNNIFNSSNIADGRFGDVQDTGTYTYLYSINLSRSEWGRVRISRAAAVLFQDLSTQARSSNLYLLTDR